MIGAADIKGLADLMRSGRSILMLCQSEWEADEVGGSLILELERSEAEARRLHVEHPKVSLSGAGSITFAVVPNHRGRRPGEYDLRYTSFHVNQMPGWPRPVTP